MPKISVIVPIYSVEKYLNRCVDSILNQTFTDFECILVDDGSPDNCGKICDEYAKKDKRVKVIHKPNGGLSDARNAGIDVAQGECLSFIDSDDWIHPQMLEILYNGIVKNNVILSVCAYEETENEKPFEKIEKPIFEIQNGMDFLVENNVTAVVAWNKLYHKGLFDNIRYPVGKIHEDEFVTYKILYKAGSIAVCDEKLYMYFVNNEGITKSEWSIKHLDAIEALEERDEWIVKHKLWEYRNWTKKHLLQVYQWQYFQLKNEKQYHKYRKNISKKIRKILLTQRKQLGIDINNYSDCYYIVFPIAMRIYGAYNIYLKKYKENGFMYAIKAVITHISKR